MMRWRQGVLVLALLLWSIAAQAAGELTGAEIIARAVESAGGESWSRPRTLYMHGRNQRWERGEAGKPVLWDDYTMWRVYPASNDAAHAANGKVRIDARTDGRIVFQQSFDGERAYNQNGPVDAAAARSGQATNWSDAFGFGILRFADQPGFVVTRMADDQVEAHPCFFVKVEDPQKQVTYFAIDQSDFAIRQVGFATSEGWHQRIYSDFAWAPGRVRFRQPTRVRLYTNGIKTSDITWTTYRVNEPIADEVFVLPGR